jgi:hypothetical protein
MPKRTSKRLDVVQNARRIVLESVGESEVTVSAVLVSQVMAAMGRKGGKIGGKRRLVTMTPERRSEIGKLAAEKRWAKKGKRKPAK